MANFCRQYWLKWTKRHTHFLMIGGAIHTTEKPLYRCYIRPLFSRRGHLGFKFSAAFHRRQIKVLVAFSSPSANFVVET
jgi:hypothetical protein